MLSAPLLKWWPEPQSLFNYYYQFADGQTCHCVINTGGIPTILYNLKKGKKRTKKEYKVWNAWTEIEF